MMRKNRNIKKFIAFIIYS